jgi:hypothetical protein
MLQLGQCAGPSGRRACGRPRHFIPGWPLQRHQQNRGTDSIAGTRSGTPNTTGQIREMNVKRWMKPPPMWARLVQKPSPSPRLACGVLHGPSVDLHVSFADRRSCMNSTFGVPTPGRRSSLTGPISADRNRRGEREYKIF